MCRAAPSSDCSDLTAPEKRLLLEILSTLRRPTSGRRSHRRIRRGGATQLVVRRRISMVLAGNRRGTISHPSGTTSSPSATFMGSTDDCRHACRPKSSRSFDLAAEAERKVQDLSGGFKPPRASGQSIYGRDAGSVPRRIFHRHGPDPETRRNGFSRKESERGRTIVLTTQILSEAEELCDDILILD